MMAFVAGIIIGSILMYAAWKSRLLIMDDDDLSETIIGIAEEDISSGDLIEFNAIFGTFRRAR